MADVLELEQFVARGAFGRPSTFGELGVRTVRQPYHFADTPMGGATPQVDDLAWQGPDGALRWPPDPRRASPDKTTGVPSGAIFEGLRVLDLGWIWSGPMVSAVLADLGADVIKIEHRGRLDNARLRKRPLVNGVPLAGPPHELSMVFHQHNRGKRSLTLDFKHPRGAQLLKELAARSDIVVENLTPGVFDRAGVGYRELSQVNPRLIWLAASSAGQDGPLAGMRAYAPIMTAMAGLEALVGYDDDPVVGMLGCGLGDPNAGSHGLLAVLAALRARELTGRGQYIDMSQIEAAAAVLVEPMVNAQLRGRQPAPWGFSHPEFAPHGHFRCLGHDQWVAVAAIDDAMWRRLADVVGISSTKAVLRHAGLEVRQRCREEIHRAIEEWTTPRDRDDVVGTLRRADVSAAPVLSLAEAMSTFDACLAHVRHPVTGEERIAPIAWDFSETPAIIQRPAPLVGEHNETILRGVLRYDGRSLEDLLDSPATT
jgi:crotonobetainyl-CoA:carnitine CoA-transferase CaiB-like acyl-CoA transferase